MSSANENAAPDPEFEEAYDTALRLMSARKNAEAKDRLTELLSKELSGRDRGRTLHSLGEIELRLGNPEAAVRNFEAAITCWPGDHLGYAFLKKIYREQRKRWDELRITLVYLKNAPLVYRELSSQANKSNIEDE